MVGVARKVQVSPSEVNATENGGERNELITVMEEMEVREEEMAEGDELVEEDCAKAEGGGLGRSMLALEDTEILTQEAQPGGTTTH